MRPVIVTTSHRGVFFGYTEDAETAAIVTLQNARCAIYWGTTRGFLELADTGPTAVSKIGARAPRITLQGVTAVVGVSEAAVRAWEQA